jgi:hypothetical protein
MFIKNIYNNYLRNIKRKTMKLSDANLGLESLIARVDEAFRVIVHNVSAALALTSAGHWFK